MKKILLLFLLLCSLSFSWERNSYNGAFTMSESEIKKFFGRNEPCVVIGYGTLLMTSINESQNPSILENTEEYAVLIAAYTDTMNSLENELNLSDNTSFNIFLRRVFDRYNCKVPDRRTLRTFGVREFEDIMNSVRN